MCRPLRRQHFFNVDEVCEDGEELIKGGDDVDRVWTFGVVQAKKQDFEDDRAGINAPTSH